MKQMRRCLAFLKQCEHCVHSHCRALLCEHCPTSLNGHCVCIMIPDKNEGTCKYFKHRGENNAQSK